MPKVILFLDDMGYQSYTLAAGRNAGALTCECPGNGLMGKLFRIHNSWRLNKAHELPFKGVWFDKVLNEKMLPGQEPHLFLFYESFHLSYSATYLDHLRRHFPKAKFCFLFSNPVNSYNKTKVDSVKSFYDTVVTFSKKDAVENKYQYYSCLPFSLPKEVEPHEISSDVFFVGSNKGRLDTIISLYEELSDAGLKCDFYVTGVESKDQCYSNEINYNQRISYDEALKHVKSSKCVVEILQNRNQYCSIRTAEAMHFGKKLLTTNEQVIFEQFYVPSLVHVIGSEGSNAAFVKAETNDVYPDSDAWRFEPFVGFLFSSLGITV